MQPDFAVAATYKWLLGPYSFGVMYVAPKWQNGKPLEDNWIQRDNAREFSGLVRYTDGYVHGGGPPRAFARAADKAFAAWSDAGRPGKPQFWAQGYFALGDDGVMKAGYRYLRDYYAFTGPFAERIAAGLLTSPQAVAQFIRGYQDAGCDELVLFPTVPDVAQLDRLDELLQAQGMGRAG